MFIILASFDLQKDIFKINLIVRNNLKKSTDNTGNSSLDNQGNI